MKLIFIKSKLEDLYKELEFRHMVIDVKEKLNKNEIEKLEREIEKLKTDIEKAKQKREMPQYIYTDI